jgi:hypothetical protein
VSTLIGKIRSRGYWQVAVRPARFVRKRISDISSLYPILQKTRVSLRGWDFPHLEDLTSPHVNIDWIGQESEWSHHISSWRFYQSGQFIHTSCMPIDWRDQSDFWPADDQWKPGALLGVGDAICCFTEIFEFAARLALTDAGDEQMHIDITVGNLRQRRLYVDTRRRSSFHTTYRASIEKYPHAVELSRPDLIAGPRGLALEAASELFKRFGWNTAIDILRDWQNEY